MFSSLQRGQRANSVTKVAVPGFYRSNGVFTAVSNSFGDEDLEEIPRIERLMEFRYLSASTAKYLMLPESVGP